MDEPQRSLKIVLDSNPFASVCGRVCFHPCEDACRREQVDSALSIMRLKRYAADHGSLSRQLPDIQPANAKKIAVIGAGPAGLTAAYELALMGYAPVVFEKTKVAGGMLYWGIPEYRLPKPALRKDIDYIRSAGVEIKTGLELGRNLSWPDLKKQGFDAYVIAVGLANSRSLDLPGADAHGVLTAIPFLTSVAAGKPMPIGGDVIVIGGGNVAVDVARTAKRLGAESIKMACLESREEMPAHDWEIVEACEEGIEIHCSRGPKQIKVEHGRVAGLEMMEVRCVFDECGRFDPKFHHKRLSTLKGDTVIISVGQYADLGFIAESSLAVNDRGQLIVDRFGMRASEPDVFVCGEVMTGPGAAVEAIAGGKKAARMVDAFVRGIDPTKVFMPEYEPLAALSEETLSKIKTCARINVWATDPKDRIKNFVEMESGYSEHEVRLEATRCMQCLGGAEVIEEKCVACLTCERICPFDAPRVNRGIAEIDEVRCQACGLCASECPAEAIEMSLFDDARLLSRILAKTKGNPRKIAFICQYSKLECVGGADDLPAGYKVFEVMCPGKLDANFYLSLFEHGATSLAFAGCKEDTCRYYAGKDKTVARFKRLQDLLLQVGFSDGAIILPVSLGESEV